MSISIASLLGPHFTNGNETLDELERQFALPHQSYLETCKMLYEKELLDATSQFEALSFEEQNLRDYFVFRAFVKDRSLDPTRLWPLKSGKQLVLHACQTLLDVFGPDETKTALADLAKDLLRCCEGKEQLEVAETFGTFLGRAGLAAVAANMNAADREAQHGCTLTDLDHVPVSRNDNVLEAHVLSALSRFYDDPTCGRAAVTLTFTYLKENSVSEGDLCELFQKRLNIGLHSFRCGYEKEQMTLDFIEKELTGNNWCASEALLVCFARGLFKDEMSYLESRSLQTITHYTVTHSYNNPLLDIRRRCLLLLVDAYEKGIYTDQITRALLDYLTMHHGDMQLFDATCDLISTYFLPNMRLETFEQCERLERVYKSKGISAGTHTALDALLEDSKDTPNKSVRPVPLGHHLATRSVGRPWVQMT